MQFQLLILAEMEVRYISPKMDFIQILAQADTHVYLANTENLIIPYKSEYLNCFFVMRTYYHYSLPTGPNDLQTNVQIYSI